MSLTAGTRLGPYEIQAAIGAGGMGEIYKARDTRLDRTVAIKILSEALTTDRSFRERFEREARLISQLDHPHICALYDVGEEQGTSFLVMPFLEGQTLAERLTKGALPLPDALTIAMQVASALDRAHRAGIVHRDLKPGNIILTKTGAKLLDFGLAKPSSPVATGAGVSGAATTAPLTGQGTLLGTFQYMAPEQLEGRPVDARTDLFAFGAVLYEMVTGRRAFEGTSQASLIAAILEHQPPPPSRLQQLTPPALDHVVATCLAKDPDERWQSAGDVVRHLKWISEHSAADEATTAGASGQRAHGRWAWGSVGLITGVVAGAMLVLLVGGRAGVQPAPSKNVVRALVDVAPAEWLQATSVDRPVNGGRPIRTPMAISPDGQSLVFSAVAGGRQQLYLRVLSESEAKPIAGTDGASAPFYSPDGESVGFYVPASAASGGLWKVSIRGSGPPVKICEAGPVFGADWGADGSIVFARIGGGLLRVPAGGGVPQALTQLDAEKNEYSHRLPSLLPGDQAVLFTVADSRLSDWESTVVVVQSLRTGERKVLIQGGSGARYVPTGHLVYMRRGTLMGVPFDLGRLEISGSPQALISDVMHAASGISTEANQGSGSFSVSASGTLVYLSGGFPPDVERSLVWVDRNGKSSPAGLQPGPYQVVRLSPDGQRFSINTLAIGRSAVWLSDMVRGGMNRVSPDGRQEMGIWTPDGKRIAFLSMTPSGRDVAWRPADASAPLEVLAHGLHNRHPHSWTPDGSQLAGIEFAEESSYNIWVLSMDGDRTPKPYLNTKSFEGAPEFSPDGKWLAYVSSESGRLEVYVQAYPGPGARIAISSDGGIQPAWSRDGREIFYTSWPPADGRTKMMVVPVTIGTNFTAGAPRQLFEGRYVATTPTRLYDLSPDGKRFLMIQDVGRAPIKPTHMVLVQNWFEELKARVPTH